MPDTTVLIEIGAAAALLLVAVAWRLHARRRADEVLRRMLRDPSPAVRRTGVESIGTQGLRPFADALIDCIRTETDPGVRGAIAQTVTRNQWEPAHDERLVALRVWTSQFYEGLRAQASSTAAPTTGAASVPPAPAQVPVAPAPTPAPAHAPAPAQVPVAPAPAPAPAHAPAPAPAHAPAPAAAPSRSSRLPLPPGVVPVEVGSSGPASPPEEPAPIRWQAR